MFHVDEQTNYSIMEFKENVTARLNHISQTGNKGLYTYIYIYTHTHKIRKKKVLSVRKPY